MACHYRWGFVKKQRIWFDKVFNNSIEVYGTFDTVMAFLKSLPPYIRKPHGEGPVKFTVSAIEGPVHSGNSGKHRQE